MGLPDLPEFAASRPENLYLSCSSALCSCRRPFPAQTASIRVANARRIVRSILLTVIDAQAKNLNFTHLQRATTTLRDKISEMLHHSK
jgi:hypothetical protein